MVLPIMEAYYFEDQKFPITEIHPLYHHWERRFLSNAKWLHNSEGWNGGVSQVAE